MVCQDKHATSPGGVWDFVWILLGNLQCLINPRTAQTCRQYLILIDVKINTAKPIGIRTLRGRMGSCRAVLSDLEQHLLEWQLECQLLSEAQAEVRRGLLSTR